MKRIGVISDTHGLLRPEALAALRGSDFLIHAGDIGDAGILEALATIAPVTAVRGNNDKGRWVESIRQTEVLRLEDVLIYVLHDLAQLDLDPAAAGFQVVVSGHSHQPRAEKKWRRALPQPGQRGPTSVQAPDRGCRSRRRRQLCQRTDHGARALTEGNVTLPNHIAVKIREVIAQGGARRDIRR